MSSLPAEAFPKLYRLSEPAEYRRAFGEGSRHADRYFVVISVTSQAEYGARLGLAISKKVARRAVDRNRIKRIIRESFRQTRCELPPRDIVILARHSTAATHSDRLFASLQEHWRRLSK